MAQTLTLQTLEAENQSFAGTGGISSANRHYGFTPGFLDRETGAVYCSCWADGTPAPFHALDGLPDDAGFDGDNVAAGVAGQYQMVG